MDVSKLTPAPWQVKPGTFDVQEPGEQEDFPCTIAKCWSSSFAPTKDIARTNRDFIILARNAFDVMMRRGWSVSGWRGGSVSGSEWMVVTQPGGHPVDNDWYRENPGGASGLQRFWPDPFTALVEADEWYKANVEGE